MNREFHLVHETNPVDFIQEVNRFLKNGWTLYGETIITTADRDLVYFQSMKRIIGTNNPMAG